MRRLVVVALLLMASLAACGADEPGFDLADQDLSRDGLRGVDLADVALDKTSWAAVDWATADIEFLVTALGLTVDDLGVRPGLQQLVDSYSAYLGADPELGTGEEDIVFWMMSVQLDSLARDLDVEGFDAFRADSDAWPDLLPDGSEQFRERMRGLVSKSFHLRQAMSIETGE